MDYWRHIPRILQKVLTKTTNIFVTKVGVPAWVQTCYHTKASREALSLEPSSVCADVIHLRSSHRQTNSSTVGVVNTLRTAKSRNRGSITSKEKRMISCSEHRQVLDPSRDFLLLFMRLEREADDSRASTVEVSDVWSCTSTPRMPSWCALTLLHSWTDIREWGSCIQHIATFDTAAASDEKLQSAESAVNRRLDQDIRSRASIQRPTVFKYATALTCSAESR